MKLFTQISKQNYKNLVVYFTTSILTALIGLCINPILASKLSHTDYAIIGYYASFTTLFLPIISFSLSTYYARNYHLLNDEKRKYLYNLILTLFSTLGLGAFVLVVIFYAIYHRFCVASIPFTPYALLSFVPIYLSCYYNLYQVDLRMSNQAIKYAIVTLTNSVVGACLSIVMVYVLTWGAFGRLLALLIASALICSYVLISTRIRFVWNKTLIQEMLSFCWPLMVSGILSYFFLGIDRPMLEQLNDNYNLGLYNVGLQLSSYLAIFGTVLLQTFDPDLYKYTSTKQHGKVLKVAVMIVVLTLIPNVCFMFVSEPIIALLTANRYIESAPFANVLCLKNVTSTCAFVLSGILIGYGYSKYELFNRSIGSLLSILLYYCLIRYFGYIGAAWGQSLSWLLMGIISLLCLLIISRKNANS